MLQQTEPGVLNDAIPAKQQVKLKNSNRFIESSSLEKNTKIIQSNRQPILTMVHQPCSSVPALGLEHELSCVSILALLKSRE